MVTEAAMMSADVIAFLKPKFVQKSRKTANKNWPRLCSILYEFLHFEVAQTSMEIMTASVTILGGETNLKTQKLFNN